MTLESGATDAAHFLLPVSVDTLEALRLGRRLQDLVSHSGLLRVTASSVEEIGLAGLQLLALIKAALVRDGGNLVLLDPSLALRERIADSGMAPLLLEAPAELHHQSLPRRSLRFTDAALDYGREPVEALHRLREAGIRVEAILSDPLPAIGSIEADRLLLRFNVDLSTNLADNVLVDALAEFGGDALIDTAPRPQQEVAARLEPLADPAVDQQTAKLEPPRSRIICVSRAAWAPPRHRKGVPNGMTFKLVARGSRWDVR